MNFCKVEDSKKNLYILTDKNKQPLMAGRSTCFIANYKKFLDNPKLIHGGSTQNVDAGASDILVPDNDTKIQFTIINNDAIVNKLDIDFNIYDIATIQIMIIDNIQEKL
jgi:hypothetical protein